MSDYDSNLGSIRCPYCETNPIYHQNYKMDIEELLDEEEDFFECPECNKFFKVELDIYKEYNYIINKPTKDEIEVHGFEENKNIQKDVEGQMFLFEDN